MFIAGCCHLISNLFRYLSAISQQISGCQTLVKHNLTLDITMEENLIKTCLHDRHVKLGALMSPFGGFDMPIQYKGITEEHNAVRHEVGVFDVSHMGEVRVKGPEAYKFVSHIFVNDVTGAPDGQIFYGMMCYENGGVSPVHFDLS